MSLSNAIKKFYNNNPSEYENLKTIIQLAEGEIEREREREREREGERQRGK